MTNTTRPRYRSLLTTAAALALALPLAACGDADDGEDAPAVTGGATQDPAPTDEGTATESDPNGESDPNDTATDGGSAGDSPAGSADPHDVVAQAISLAEEEAGGTAFEVDLEDDGEWEITVAVGDEEIDVVVSPDGSEVRSSGDADSLDDDERAALDAATIGVAEAVATALAEVDGTFDDVDLDDEDDTVAWEVTVDRDGDDDVEVYIDVTTGDVLRIDDN